jgi:hypothetical protein
MVATFFEAGFMAFQKTRMRRLGRLDHRDGSRRQKPANKPLEELHSLQKHPADRSVGTPRRLMRRSDQA